MLIILVFCVFTLGYPDGSNSLYTFPLIKPPFRRGVVFVFFLQLQYLFGFRAERIYEEYLQFRAMVTYDGRVHWEPGGVFKTMCPIEITYYPFDSQHCDLVYGAWAFHTAKMNLTNSEENINIDSYENNGEWEIFHTSVKRNEFNYECCPHQRFSNVAFGVYMKRRHTFYILNVILPSIMTSVLLLSIFFCTPGQKVQIGVVVLLSFRIFLLNVADNIPKTSDHVPLLGRYNNHFYRSYTNPVVVSSLLKLRGGGHLDT